jgi:uncharacterized membrane protein YdjX (TVP38/TMEM64 family)
VDNEATTRGPVVERTVWETFRSAGAAGPLALLAVTLPAVGGFVLLARIDPVAEWLRSNEGMGIVIYSCAFAVLSGLAILPTYAQAALGGWAFGLAGGFPAAILGIVGGALIGRLIASRAASKGVMSMIEERPGWSAVRTALVERGWWRTLGLVTLLRLPPNSPFALTNLALGVTRVPVVTVLLATAVGLAPRTALAVYLASGVQERFAAEKPPKMAMFIATALLTIIVVVVIGKISQNALARVAAGAGDPGVEGEVVDTLAS